jgi:DNA processing protein
MVIFSDLTEVLQHIPAPPEHLFVKSTNLPDLLQRPRLAIVGSRKISAYGKGITASLSSGLARAGVVIVSGLALGVDGLAHRAALEAGGLTIAVLPGSLEDIYPASHRQLAEHIVRQGGALITEYGAGTRTYPGNFIARNRLISGLSDAVLITEAAQKSGSLHTARFALEQGKDVLAVPGNITSPTSAGTNNLIRSGAVPITCIADVFMALGIQSPALNMAPKGDNPDEQTILDLIYKGSADGADLQRQSGLDIQRFNQTLTMLEITGKIRSLGANQWSLV